MTLALLLCVSAPLRLCAQTTDTIPKPRVPSYVRYGKWVALGGAIALGYQANQSHQDANDSYQTLRDRCFSTPLACEIMPSGRYADAVSEQLYLVTRDRDHRAARYLVGAEVSFAAAAAGFVWELLKREDRTPNVPFEPRIEAGATSTRGGLTVRF
ncbi:MAG TPA: hypothetical protein VF454_03680 [Gemmatimonadales bacterium]